MPFALVCVLSLVLAGLCLASLAMRFEHLVVLHLPREGIVFLERQGSGRYASVAPVLVPVVVLRFAARALSLAPAAARRLASRVGARLAIPVSGKA